jgi:hypothetical protein
MSIAQATDEVSTPSDWEALLDDVICTGYEMSKETEKL